MGVRGCVECENEGGAEEDECEVGECSDGDGRRKRRERAVEFLERSSAFSATQRVGGTFALTAMALYDDMVAADAGTGQH